jgi:uncharacterized protein (TIGR00369 family)
MYASAPINRSLAPVMTVSNSHAEIAIRVRPDLFHAGGAVHGAILFKLLDDAAFFAANSLVLETMVLTASFNVHFTRAVAEGRIRATGDVVHRTRKTFIADSVAVDSEGRQVARGSGNFVVSRIPLDAGVGYG